jgi:hypothetical protein
MEEPGGMDGAPNLFFSDQLTNFQPGGEGADVAIISIS